MALDHEFTYANLGHGEKDLFISACACGATRILHRTTSNRWQWVAVEQIGKLPICTCSAPEDESIPMHSIEGFGSNTHPPKGHDDDEQE